MIDQRNVTVEPWTSPTEDCLPFVTGPKNRPIATKKSFYSTTQKDIQLNLVSALRAESCPVLKISMVEQPIILCHL